MKSYGSSSDSLLFSVGGVYSAKMTFKEWASQEWVKQVVSTVIIVAGMLGWLSIYHFPAMIDSQTKTMSGEVSSLKTDVTNEKGDIKRIDNNVSGLLKELVDGTLSSLKDSKKQGAEIINQRLDLVARVVGAAKKANVRADPSALSEAGKVALDLTSQSRFYLAASNTTRQLLDYRSFLNAQEKPNTAEAKIAPDQEICIARFKRFDIPGQPLKIPTVLLSPDFVPASEAAIVTV